MYLKSSHKDLQDRGFATQQDIELLGDKSEEELLKLLHADNPVIRTASADNLSITPNNEENVVAELLKQLSVERCLYTKMAIGECLEKGNIHTASQMVCYLGKIGNNQHRQLPDRVSLKKSFPLPRDIIARSLAKMPVTIFPILLAVLQSGETEKICEVLDAIGFMAFYNPQLSIEKHVQEIQDVMVNHKENLIIQWKAILCLSAFPLEKSKRILNGFISQNTLLGKEAQRSLKRINERL